MGYWDQTDLENALSPATVIAIFDDTDTGVVNEVALAAIVARSDTEVNTYIATNYPDLVLPLAASPTPNSLKFCSLEFGIVFARDRKPEYWSKAQEGERDKRLASVRAKMVRILEAEQQLYDTASPKPYTTGGIVVDNGIRTIIDSYDGTKNGEGF
jgi:Protein of unknown function (DUF1320)